MGQANQGKKINSYSEIDAMANDSTFVVLQKINGIRKVRQFTKEKFLEQFQAAIINPTSYTYDELEAIRAASELVVGASCLISDATDANIVLLVEASAVNAIDCEAKDPLYPNDVIKYDFENNQILSRIPLDLIFRSVAGDVMNISKDGVAAFKSNDIFYLYGGWNGGSTIKTDNKGFRSLDFGLTWEAIADAPWTGRHTVAGVQVGEDYYFAGGDIYNLEYNGAFSKVSYKFDSLTQQWVLITSDNGMGARFLAQLVYHNAAFYLIGGQSDRTTPEGVYYNVLKSTDNLQTFTEIATNIPFGGNLWGAVTSFNGKIWKIGGGRYTDDLNQRVYDTGIYSSVDGITWVLEGEIPFIGRQYAQLSILNDELILTHGFNHTTSTLGNLSDIWRSKDGVNWVEVPNADFTRHAHTAWVYENNLYWVGGTTNSQSGILNSVAGLFYLDVQYKNYPPSIETLPGTSAIRDDVGTISANYFKMDKSQSVITGAAPTSLMGLSPSNDKYIYPFNKTTVKKFLGSLSKTEWEEVFTYDAGQTFIGRNPDNSIGIVSGATGSDISVFIANALGETLLEMTNNKNSRFFGNLSVDNRLIASIARFNNLPTSSVGLEAGDVWNDSGTLKIVT